MASNDTPPPKVSKELEHAAEDDWHRSVRDAAKHRAVAQMENYDGFKNMVSVAHLRPWHAENLKDHSGPAPPAFAFAADGTHAGPSKNPGMTTSSSLGRPDARDAFAPPENSMQFDKTWRRRCVGGAARWRYLGLMRDEDVDKVFAVDITGATLGEIAEALAEGFERVSNDAANDDDGDGDVPEKIKSTWRGVSESDQDAVASSVVRLLDRVCRAGRFDLARRLISGKAKKALAKLFDALETRRALSSDKESAPPPSVDALREAFGVC
jgi:hypothetical protein